MSSNIEVRVAGRGKARGDELEADASMVARCGLCGADVDLVVSLTDYLFACRNCLRSRLDATSVAVWRLGEPGKGGSLPWGKVAG